MAGFKYGITGRAADLGVAASYAPTAGSGSAGFTLKAGAELWFDASGTCKLYESGGWINSNGTFGALNLVASGFLSVGGGNGVIAQDGAIFGGAGFYLGLLYTDVTWKKGSGSPEGAVAAPVGSLYSRTNGGAGTTLYVKESGSGNTGWVPK